MVENSGPEKSDLDIGLATEIIRIEKEEKKGLVKAVMVIGVSFAVTVMVVVISFLVYLYQYDFASYNVESYDNGTSNFIGGDGSINGENNSEIPNTEGR